MESSLIIIIIAQVFGLISWILLIYSYTKEKINELLFIQIFVAIFDIVSYLLLGADAGLLICLMELIKTILYYKSDNDKPILIISIIGYLLIGLLTIKHWYASLPIIASLIDSYGTSKDSKMANITSIVSNILWAIYDIIILSYIGAFSDVVVAICNICVIFMDYKRHLRISKFRIIKYNYLSKDTIDKIYKLDLKNYGKDNLWDKEYQSDVFKQNNDSFFAIEYNNEFMGYINYLNVVYDEYERLKRLRTMPDTLKLNDIIKFKKKKKSYIVIESINVKKKYDKNETIELINKKFISFLNTKRKRKIYIHGILGYAITEFENDVYTSLNFKKIKNLKDNITLYELNEDDLKKRTI